MKILLTLLSASLMRNSCICGSKNQNRYTNNRYNVSGPPMLTHNQQNNIGNWGHRKNNNIKLYFTFGILKTLSEQDSNTVVSTIAEKKSEFEELLRSNDNPDILILIFRVLANVCQANFTETVIGVLSHACSANFLKKLEAYITKIPFESDLERKKNLLYHQDTNKFWSNLIDFFKIANELLPSKARDELRSILEKLGLIFDTIQLNKKYTIDPTIREAAKKMLQELNEEMQRIEESKKRAETDCKELQKEEEDPPENFRELSTIPSVQDFYNPRPYIRPCKIKDAYNSVEHYLDVQFRLLREDFVSPLRDGLQEYLHGGKGKNYDLRVYKDVKLITPEQNKNNIGIVIFFGVRNCINWRFSKRFMYGGLLLLSNDNFQTILFATVADRNEKELQKGYLMIEPCEGSIFTREMYNTKFVMLESKIYFEPYFAVLNAMKRMSYRDFPMQIYLINGKNRILLPEYLRTKPVIKCGKFDLPAGQLTEGWPDAYKLGLDESQYDAFKCALTQEFAVIQGPPGTGKTFIALKIVRTLLDNSKSWIDYGPIVIVCLTNHALDQFLEGMLKHTKSILRIGGRSKSEVLQEYTLKERRKSVRIPKYNNHGAYELMYRKKHELEEILRLLHGARLAEKMLATPNAIVPVVCLKRYCDHVNLRPITNNEELLNWLTGLNQAPPPPPVAVIPPQQVENNPEIIPQENLDHDDGYLDDELELDYKFEVNNSHQPIFPIQAINAIIDDIRQQIHTYRQTYPINALPFDPSIELEEHIFKLIQQREFLQQMLAQHPILNPQQRQPLLPPRWRMYWEWVRTSFDKSLDEKTNLEADFRQVRIEHIEAKQMTDLELLKAHQIIGLTTNGAARLQASVRALRAPIVVVEEAAEILESQVVCSLSRECKHVILIGDHKQLKPKASVYELGKKYNLNISLFERMVNIQGDCTQLQYQHRMRPAIASLITPSIYEKLYNHKSVHHYPHVMGLQKDLFFINHSNREISHNNEESWVNEHEAKYLVALARYLVLQRYEASEVTILCTYTGQVFLLKKEIERYSILRDVRVTTVDNFQGEENRIILLSLVRNNGEGKIGFLKEENRVCVALSRAREGMYIMGNIDDLTVKEGIWTKIKQVLEEKHAIGHYLRAQCQIHTEELTQLQHVGDFEKCPEGGCLLKCNNDLPCGHTCTSVCHILDRIHEKYECKQPCNKSCPNDHPCQLICWQGCRPCHIMVERTLKCGHTVKMLCSSDPESFPCYIEIEATLPDCNHMITKQCHVPIEECRCTHPCEDRLPCGHTCQLKCHVTRDPDHLKYKCMRDCTNYNLNCKNEHMCKKRCFEQCQPCPILVEKLRSCGHYYKTVQCSLNIEDVTCKRNCNRGLMECGHKCTLKCFEPCGKCSKLVKKTSNCGHIVEVKCCEEATVSKCGKNCKKVLPCGHPCTKNCKEVCTIRCKKMIKLSEPGLCGHVFSVPCYLGKADARSPEIMKYCQEPCKTQLQCEHKCGGTCGQCKQERLHIPCVAACNSILVCGHPCNIPCIKDCQPCTKRCELKCQHSKCNKKCGVPCAPCKEWCSWGCEHRRCKKLCNELCDIEPCSEPCKKMLKCNHPCVGFCGDPCPPLCRICDKDELTEIFFGNEDEPDARFVLLEDCSHCIENEGLMRWLEQSKGVVQLKTCPKCKTPIKKCMRFMNEIKKHLNDVTQVKKKTYYRNKKDLTNEQKTYVQNLKDLLSNPLILEFPALQEILKTVLKQGELIRKQKAQFLSAQEIDAFKIINSNFEAILEILKGIKKGLNSLDDTYKLVKNQIVMLSSALPSKLRISQQEISDLHLEIGRLSCMVEMCNTDKPINDGMAYNVNYKTEYDAAMKKLLSIERFTEVTEKEVQSAIMKLRNSEEIKRERQMIVKAVNLGKGHWFKCPNGHFYAIGECGGAMQTSKCPECGAQIGGQNHTL